MNELRRVFRRLTRAKTFSLAVVFTLTTALVTVIVVSTLVDRALLRPLPFENSDRLIELWEHGKNAWRLPSYQTFREWQAQTRTLAGLAFVRLKPARMSTSEGPRETAIAYVTPGFFQLLGTRPLIGRLFTPAEERAGQGRVAVLTYDMWRREFVGDRAILGRTIVLDGDAVTIIGVMPQGVAFPAWPEMWRPIGAIVNTDPALRGWELHTDSRVIGLPKPNTSVKAVLAELAMLQARLAAILPDDMKDWPSADSRPVKEEMVGDTGPSLIALAGAGALVWILVCINVANLALVRAADRRRELAVRFALGATRARVVGEIAGEMILLTLIASTLGIGLSYVVVGFIRNAAPTGLPRLAELTIDGRVLAFAAASSITTGLICGLLPALRASAVTSLEALRDARSTGIGGRHRVTVRAALTVGQIGLALTLFIGSTLLARSFVRLSAVDLGFDPSDLLVVWVHPPSPQYDTPAAAAALYRRLMAATAAVPGVLGAAVTNHIPLVNGWVETHVSVPGRTPSPADIALYKTVSHEYLAVMRIALLKGRWLDDGDVDGDGNAVVINDVMARHYWPNEDPVGRAVVIHRASQGRAGFGAPMPSVVVGVVKGLRHFGPAVEPPPEVYVPYTREVWPGIAVVVRTAKDPAAMIPTLQRVLHAEEPGIPLAAGADGPVIRTMTSYESESLASRHYLTWLVGGFAASALIIALIGVYGLTAHTVTRRTPEIGVRVALGARPVDVMWLVIGQGLRLSIAGAVVGVPGALGSGRLLNNLLYQTSPADLWSFSLATCTLIAAVLLATTIPARRATRLDPAMAMRAE